MGMDTCPKCKQPINGPLSFDFNIRAFVHGGPCPTDPILQPGEALWDAIVAAKNLGAENPLVYAFADLTEDWRKAHAKVEADWPRGTTSNDTALLQRYGRHDMRCPTGGLCDCGFGEVEKRWQNH